MAEQRTWLSLGLVAALFPASVSGQPSRRVATDLQISSTRVAKALPAEIPELRKRIAASLAEVARGKFGYLEWVTRPAEGDGEPQLLALEVFDEKPPGSPCSANVLWRFVGHAKVAFTGPAQDLYDGCDPTPRFKNPRDFEDDLTRAVKTLPEQSEKIQKQFLRWIPLVSGLDPDPANRIVLLPRAAGQLFADSDSTLRVDFTVDQKSGEMSLRPMRQAAGGRTQVRWRSLFCPPIVPPCPTLTDGTEWNDSLPGLIQRSSDLRVFMVEYVPDLARLAGQTREGTLPDLEP